MSLDVYLKLPHRVQTIGTGVFVRDNGARRELSLAEVREKWPDADVSESASMCEYVFDRNITHNLNTMAGEAGLYECLWRPDEIGITKAEQLIEPLSKGLALLESDPERFKAFNPYNGWGDYAGLCAFVSAYLDACREYPDAEVSASR